MIENEICGLIIFMSSSVFNSLIVSALSSQRKRKELRKNKKTCDTFVFVSLLARRSDVIFLFMHRGLFHPSVRSPPDRNRLIHVFRSCVNCHLNPTARFTP